MKSTSAPSRPAFSSVSNYNHPSGLFSFWYAPEWQLHAAEGDAIQIVLIPDPQDPFSREVIEVKDVTRPLAPAERKVVLEGVHEGLSQLPEGKVDSFATFEENNRWGIDWLCTFAGESSRVQRRVRLFYSDHYQYSITVQGSTEEQYAYWKGMMEFTMFSLETAPFKIDPHRSTPLDGA